MTVEEEIKQAIALASNPKLSCMGDYISLHGFRIWSVWKHMSADELVTWFTALGNNHTPWRAIWGVIVKTEHTYQDFGMASPIEFITRIIDEALTMIEIPHDKTLSIECLRKAHPEMATVRRYFMPYMYDHLKSLGFNFRIGARNGEAYHKGSYPKYMRESFVEWFALKKFQGLGEEAFNTAHPVVQDILTGSTLTYTPRKTKAALEPRCYEQIALKNQVAVMTL